MNGKICLALSARMSKCLCRHRQTPSPTLPLCSDSWTQWKHRFGRRLKAKGITTGLDARTPLNNSGYSQDTPPLGDYMKAISPCAPFLSFSFRTSRSRHRLSIRCLSSLPAKLWAKLVQYPPALLWLCLSIEGGSQRERVWLVREHCSALLSSPTFVSDVFSPSGGSVG
jgi:hypothetical protein